ncbi:MAG: hypothetical protein WKG07_23180 [Hymenobacter sp.]
MERNAKLQQEGLRLIRIQKQAGRVTELAVRQFAAQALRTESLAYETPPAHHRNRNQPQPIAGPLPAGHRPHPAAARAEPAPAPWARVPATALLHRPDVRQAELELRATTPMWRPPAPPFCPRSPSRPTWALTRSAPARSLIPASAGVRRAGWPRWPYPQPLAGAGRLSPGRGR